MGDTRVVTTPAEVVSASRRGYILTAAVLLAVMAGGTLPIPLYVLYEKQMGFGPLGVTVVFAAYVIGTLSALVAFGDLSDHIGRKKLSVWPCWRRRCSPRRCGCSWPARSSAAGAVTEHITSSRWPDDLPAFCARIVEQFAAPGNGHGH